MATVWGELRRRNVFKVGAAYAIVAWLLLQITDVVLPTFNTPQWVAQTITFVLAIGFPIAIVLAWAYEITPVGIKTDARATENVAPQRSGKAFNYFLLGLIVPTLAFLVLDRFLLASRSAAPNTNNVSALFPQGIDTVVRRTTIDIGLAEPLGNTQLNAHLALSADGRYLAYSAQLEGIPRLYLRPLDQLEARALPGTEDAYHPFFSPDGEWLVYVTRSTDRKLKRVSIRGGPPRELADGFLASTGSWFDNERFAFASTEGDGGARIVFRVHTGGIVPERLLGSPPGSWYVWPEVLPNGQHMLIVVRPQGGNASDGRISVVDLESNEIRPLIENAYRPRYVPTGHIAFMRAGALWAVPFDLQRLEKTGPEMPLIDSVQADGVIGGAAFTFAPDGTLVYISGEERRLATVNELVWVDRAGRETAAAPEPRDVSFPKLSPDGRRLAHYAGISGIGDIWVYDFSRGTPTQVTFSAGYHYSPVWAPDGERVAFSTNGGLSWITADGAGEMEQLIAASSPLFPLAFSSDGLTLLYREGGTRGTISDLHALSLGEERVNQPLFQTPDNEPLASLSPDGNWLAYQSDKTGEYEIYVRPFPNVGDREWRISQNGGDEPIWGPQGSGELYYRQGNTMMSVSYESNDTFLPSVPVALFSGEYYDWPQEYGYDVASDGKFLMLKNVAARSERTQLVLVNNWFEELKRRAPPDSE